MRRKRLALPPALGAAGPYAAPKEEANVSSSEAVLGMQLVLPAQAALAQHVDTAETREEIPSTVKTYAEAIREEPVKRGSFVYIRNGPAGKPLSPTVLTRYWSPVARQFSYRWEREPTGLLLSGSSGTEGTPSSSLLCRLHVGAHLIS